ncbi:MAG: hypothetical protein RLZZ337_1509 [Bacteroidota bacterium]
MLFLCFIPFVLKAQNLEQKAAEIMAEGKLLYQTEMASWYGTDLFLMQFGDREKIAGYFSYLDKEVPTCVFFSYGEIPDVLGTITFDSTYNLDKANADLTLRNFTPLENDLFKLRKAALDEVTNDTFFKTYSNTNLNLIPLITSKEKKVYILTGPTQSGVVLLGNDYLLEFDDDYTLKSKKALHKNLIPIEYRKKDDASENAGITVHNHSEETGDFITATDVCTLMLYAKFAGWQMHYTVSADYLSTFNCRTNQPFIITMDALEKIQKDQKKRKKR